MNENKTPTDGGTAFPRPFSEDTYFDYEAQEGMSLRDYFAAKAMQALARHGNYFDATARQAYMIADAMLREREK